MVVVGYPINVIISLNLRVNQGLTDISEDEDNQDYNLVKILWGTLIPIETG